jgi:phthiodiolone/phenolphthiodiolone dimycocerosates ketoreductase
VGNIATAGAPGGIIPPIENVIKNARRNEEQGYWAIWWPDHLMGWHPSALWTPDLGEIAALQRSPHVYLDPFVTMAAVAASTDRVRLGTSVTDVFRHHPAMLARAFLSLDHITRGRVILGIGAGEGENLVPYGIEFDKPLARLREALEVIRLLWSSDGPVDYRGRFFRLEGAVLGLRPYGEAPPPIWLAAHGPRFLELAGRMADGWIPMKMPADQYAASWAAVRQAARAAGRDPEAITPAMYAFTVVHRSHQRCHELIAHPFLKNFALLAPASLYTAHGAVHPLGRGAYGLLTYIPERLSRAEALAAVREVPDEVAQAVFLHGTPDDIAEEIAALAAAGLRHIVLWNVTFFADMSLVRESFGLLAEVVRLIEPL